MEIAVKRTALVVVDGQRGFTSLCPVERPVSGGLEIVPAAGIDASAAGLLPSTAKEEVQAPGIRYATVADFPTAAGA